MSLAVDIERVLRAVPERARRAGAVAAAARHLRLRRRLPEPVPQVDLERARALLAEAGYRNGIDPATGRPLHLTFDTRPPPRAALLQFQFFVDAWRRLGLDVEIAATTYNQFQDKVRRGAYQIFMWGWIADYPDPENFLFLLWRAERPHQERRPEHRQLRRPALRRAVPRMKDMPNDAERVPS